MSISKKTHFLTYTITSGGSKSLNAILYKYDNVMLSILLKLPICTTVHQSLLKHKLFLFNNIDTCINPHYIMQNHTPRMQGALLISDILKNDMML